ncbi:MAG: hypothetical protein U0230_25025 [Polyangiales bacterium]
MSTLMRERRSVIDEAIHAEPSLADHRDILGAVVDRFEAEGFDTVYIDYKGETSSVEWEPNRSIRIGKPSASSLFDVLHELGHVLSGRKDDELRNLAREEDAWSQGWVWLETTFPAKAKALKGAFEARRAECLGTYGAR